MSLPYPNIDPVAIHLGPLPIRWYSLAYIGGLAAGWWYLTRLLKKPQLWPSETPPVNRTQLDDVIFWVALGVIGGGRLGYLLFYDPAILIQPWPSLGAGLEPGFLKTIFGWIHIPPALMLWQGGMSFHGGLIGVTLAGWLYSRKHKINPLSLGDLFANAAPIGLFFGRIANFINGELYGRPWNGPWAMSFPEKGIHGEVMGWTELRHPSQLYEAVLEGIILFLVIRIATYRFRLMKKPGAAIGLFLICYASARIFVENFRMPDVQMPDFPLGLTMGMILSIPMFALGVWLMWRAHDKSKSLAAKTENS